MDLRSTLLNYILNALFRDTPLAYLSSRHVTYVTHVTRVTHMTHDTQVADRPNMCYIFEKVMVQGPQKQCSQVSDVQTHKDKYRNKQIQNTQIQFWSKLQIGPTCAIYLKR